MAQFGPAESHQLSGDDVTIGAGTTVTVNTGLAASHDITINAGGTLTFNAGMLLEVYGDFTNDGTLNAGTGNISFTGARKQHDQRKCCFCI